MEHHRRQLRRGRSSPRRAAWWLPRAAAPPPTNRSSRRIELKSSAGQQRSSRKCSTLRRGVQRGLIADIRVIGGWRVEPHRHVVNPIAASSTDSQTCAARRPHHSVGRPIISANSRLRPPRVRRLYLHEALPHEGALNSRHPPGEVCPLHASHFIVANIRVTRRRSALRPPPSFGAAILQEEKHSTAYDLRLTGGRSISVPIHAVDPRRMKRGRVGWWHRQRGRPTSGALSPYISWTRNSTSTPYCEQRSKSVQRAY
jgi:hypothetical protein